MGDIHFLQKTGYTVYVKNDGYTMGTTK